MRRLVSVFCLVLLFAPRPVRAADVEVKQIESVVEQAMKELDVPGAAVVVVKDDEVIFLKGFGVREKGKKDRVSPDTVFPIASCSKAFTSALIAMLVDEGKLAWDDKVHKHLEYFRLSDELADREVTIRDLLCHRTGMPRHDMLWAGLPIDSGELIRRWGKGTPSTSFRSTWEYSNVPFTTAGVIAGEMGKGTWAKTVEEKLFKPLEMTSTSCTAAGGQAASDHVTPHYYGLDKAVTPLKWDNLDHAGGAGCVNSTVTDMGNWLRFQLAEGKLGNKRLLGTKALRETHSPQMLVKTEGVWSLYFPPKATRFTSYGMGWFVHDYRGYTCISHGGTLSGIRAQCLLVPEKKLGVFAVCNIRPSLFPEAVTKSIADLVLGLPAEEWVKFSKEQLSLLDFNTALRIKKRDKERKPDTHPSLPLKAYAGAYTESAYGKAEVVLEDEKLMIRWGNFVFRLDHYNFDTFTAVPLEPSNETITLDRSTLDVLFRLGTNGEVEGLKFLDQEFKKKR